MNDLNDSEFDYDESWHWGINKPEEPIEKFIGYISDVAELNTSNEVWERTKIDGSKVLVLKPYSPQGGAVLSFIVSFIVSICFCCLFVGFGTILYFVLTYFENLFY